MSDTITRPLRRIGAIVALSAVVLGASAGAAMAASAPGTVNTAGAPLTVRSGPGTGYGDVGSVADGTHVTISCQATGTSVTGTYGTSRIWDQIGTKRFVSDAYVYTGHDGQFLSTCSGGGGGGGTLVDDYRLSVVDPDGNGIDKYSFYDGQCTSFVAWRINDRRHLPFNNYYRGQHFGNANLWDDAARNLSIPVNNTPSVGAVAQWNSGSFGHVAWVTRVNAGGTVTIEEYNYTHSEHYDYRTVSVGSVENFIHF